MDDGELRRRYGAVWALMACTPGQPMLPTPGPVELASMPGLLREMWIRYRPLAYMLEVSSGYVLNVYSWQCHRRLRPCSMS